MTHLLSTRAAGSPDRRLRARLFRPGAILCLFLASAFSVLAQSPDPSPPAPTASSSEQPQSPLPGTISGSIVDQTGVPIAGAQVILALEVPASSQQVLSDGDGQFSFFNVPAGSFELTVTSAGLAPRSVSGILHSGENLTVPQVVLAVATEVTEVRVGLSPVEEAEVQIQDQEKQRVLGFVPNFYVTYVQDAVPLTPKQKFELAWKTTRDPVSFGLTAAIAGVQQADDAFTGYGQGAQGYAKRFGASYADFAIGTFLGSAVLPALLKQDPRYFYKGTGGKRSRLFYALANAVICKGDNGRWQPNYSSVLGSLSAGGISNLYYPASDRGARLTFENAGIALAATAGVNVLQEFVVRKLTPASSHPNSTHP